MTTIDITQALLQETEIDKIIQDNIGSSEFSMLNQ
jgi:hypothetical protein